MTALDTSVTRAMMASASCTRSFAPNTCRNLSGCHSVSASLHFLLRSSELGLVIVPFSD